MAEQFALQIAKFAKKAQGNMDMVVRKVALDLLGRVVKRTPVDTGRARGNWQLGINSVPRGESGAAGAGRTVAAMAVTTGTAAALQAKMGDRVYIVNSVPYIFSLEHGSSKQAPSGMVRVTLQEYTGIVKIAAGDARRGT